MTNTARKLEEPMTNTHFTASLKQSDPAIAAARHAAEQRRTQRYGDRGHGEGNDNAANDHLR